MFTRFKEHNWYLFEHTAVDNKFIVDGDNTKTNQAVIEALPDHYIIFTTYSYFSTGIDVPSLNSLIITLPTKNKFKQVIGRILWSDGGKYALDISDNNRTCDNQLAIRIGVYTTKGFELSNFENEEFQTFEDSEPISSPSNFSLLSLFD